MMNPIQSNRISIESSFSHPWFSKFAKNYLSLSKTIAYDVIANMRSLKILYGFQKSVLLHMVKSMLDPKEKENL